MGKTFTNLKKKRMFMNATHLHFPITILVLTFKYVSIGHTM